MMKVNLRLIQDLVAKWMVGCLALIMYDDP